MQCRNCLKEALKNGYQKDGTQRYYCKNCRFSFQDGYKYKAYENGIDNAIGLLLVEGCGIVNISRILEIAPNTVTKRIFGMAGKIQKPPISFGSEYEVGAYAKASATV